MNDATVDTALVAAAALVTYAGCWPMGLIFLVIFGLRQ